MLIVEGLAEVSSGNLKTGRVARKVKDRWRVVLGLPKEDSATGTARHSRLRHSSVVEQQHSKLSVAGSNPALDTKTQRLFRLCMKEF